LKICNTLLSPIDTTRVGFTDNSECPNCGAVTHVWVNDPTGGYEIFIENMLMGAKD